MATGAWNGTGPGRAVIRIAAFASGGGTNVQALLDHFAEDGPGREAGRVVLVISDRADAGALERARRAGVGTQVVAVAGREEGDVANETIGALESARVDLVALAGYVRLIPAPVVRRFAGRMLNVHPALLPAFGGKGMYGRRIHQAVIERGCTVTGVTVHYVDESYDEGPILCQWPVPVLPGDAPETLAARVLAVEHRLYPAAAELVARSLAERRVRAEGGPTVSDGPLAPIRPISPSGLQAFGLRSAAAPPLEEVRRALGLGLMA